MSKTVKIVKKRGFLLLQAAIAILLVTINVCCLLTLHAKLCTLHTTITAKHTATIQLVNIDN